MKIFILVIVAIFYPLCAVAGWFGPSSYEECVLKNMKGVTSDKAAIFINISCREKFPVKENPDEFEKMFGESLAQRNLNPEEVSKLSISVVDYNSYETSYKCNVYNGNTSITVSLVIVDIPGSSSTKKYAVPVQVKPQSASSVWIKTMPGESKGTLWRIAGATGS